VSYRIGVASDRGLPESRGGRARNEDNYLVCADGTARWLHREAPHEQPAHGDGVLVAVFDGIGGHDEGHVASGAAAKVLAKLYQPGAPHRPSRVLTRYLREAHQKLHYRARGPDGSVRMGTTVVAAWLLRRTLSWVNVGDSRIYLFRRNSLEQLSVDHTRNTFRLRDGLPPEPGGDHLAQGFIYGSRGLGHDMQLRIEDGIDNGEESLGAGDVFLLCSDGVSGFVERDTIADVLHRFESPQQAADRLVSAALAAGSTDNITALVLRVDGFDEGAVDDWLDDGEETVQF
jgi:protein phosphatase